MIRLIKNGCQPELAEEDKAIGNKQQAINNGQPGTLNP
jgi:hypothetical protein